MIDAAAIVKILKNPGDLPAAAKALGMEHTTLKIPGVDEGNSTATLLRLAFERLARSAQMESAEVIELAGAPAMLKGKRVRILAVLEDIQSKGAVAGD